MFSTLFFKGGILFFIFCLLGIAYFYVIVLSIEGDKYDRTISTSISLLGGRYFSVQLPNKEKFLHAKVELTLVDGMIFKRILQSKQGFLSKQTNIITFGLNKEKFLPKKIKITLLNGELINKGQEELQGNILIISE